MKKLIELCKERTHFTQKSHLSFVFRAVFDEM